MLLVVFNDQVRSKLQKILWENSQNLVYIYKHAGFDVGSNQNCSDAMRLTLPPWSIIFATQDNSPKTYIFFLSRLAAKLLQPQDKEDFSNIWQRNPWTVSCHPFAKNSKLINKYENQEPMALELELYTLALVASLRCWQWCNLPETNGLPLKIGGWKTILSFWVSAHFQGRTVSFGRVGLKSQKVFPNSSQPVSVQTKNCGWPESIAFPHLTSPGLLSWERMLFFCLHPDWPWQTSQPERCSKSTWATLVPLHPSMDSG